MKFLSFLFFLLINSPLLTPSLAQQSKVDSLLNLLDLSKADTNRVKILNALAWQHYDKDTEKIKQYAGQALQLAQQLKYIYGIARSNNNLGSYYYYRNEHKEALLYYQKALQHYELCHNQHGIIMSTSNIGRCLKDAGRYPEAMNYLLKSLQFAENAHETLMAANILNTIGDLMEKQERVKEALAYYTQALTKSIAANNKKEEAICLNNIGCAYMLLKQYTKSTEYLIKSLEISSAEKLPRYEALAFNNLGMVSLYTNDFDKALHYFKQSLAISEKGEYISATIKATYGIAKVNMLKGKTQEAISFYRQGLQLAESHSLVKDKITAYDGLTQAYKKQRKFSEALDQQSNLLALRDSLLNEENTKKINHLQANYEIEKKQAEIELLKKDGQLLKKDTERATLVRNTIGAGLLATLMIAGLLLSRQRLKIRQNRLLLEKSAEVTQKNLQLEQQARVLEEQTIALANQTEKLKELDQVKSTFFANISHEFRTPLTLILSTLRDKLAADTATHEKLQVQRSEIQMMHRNASRLLQLITQLLDLSKIESGKMKLETAAGDLVQFFRVVAGSFYSLAQQRRITFELKLDDTCLPARFDEDKLEKIVANLLSNAFKFTPDGGNICMHVQVQNREEASPTLAILVEDNGPGIAADGLDKVFERFYQSTTYYSDGQGTGIGLALTKELVDLHGGSIRVESEKGKGARFYVSLPYLPAAETEELATQSSQTILVSMAQPIAAHPQNTPIIHLIDELDTPTENIPEKDEQEQPLILVVEDNGDLRAYIRTKLTPTYRVIESENGVKGLEKALATMPDLIISDWMMPDMDGLQLCGKLKTDERTCHIPVILLTALATAESKFSGLERGADEYLTKPFDARELEIRVKNLIATRRKLRERFSRRVLLQPKDIEVTSTDERFLQKAMQLVEEKMGDSEFGVDAFSKEIGMSRMQLHRKLTALTGQSTTDFVRTMRLKRAVKLLEGHNGNITDIAYGVGFNNLSYFAKCFREQYGMSPNEYLTKYDAAS